MNGKTQGAETHLDGRWLVLMRSIWVLVSLFSVVLYSADFPIRHERLLHFFHEDVLPGRSPHFYAAYLMVLDLATALAYGTAALVIFWRRYDDRAALITSLALVTFGVAVSPATDLLQTSSLEWRATFAPLQTLGRGLAIIALYTFPDGRFVLGWTRPVAVLYGLWLLFSLCFPAAPFSWYALSRPLFLVAFIVPFASAVFAQLYRYRRCASLVQRQQTKWIVFGSSAAVAGRILFAVYHRVAPAHAAWLMVSANLLWVVLLALPITFGVAILRHRLWDIDLIIRRTLLYSALTAILALVYLASVVLLQRLFQLLTGQEQSPFVTVLSTLAIAALFTPLHHRLQTAIDRRFYRRRYDAEQVLASFSAAVRDETNLERLAAHLRSVVAETLQPAQVSLWLRETDHAPVQPERTG
jgi:hypothetical protein